MMELFINIFNLVKFKWDIEEPKWIEEEKLLKEEKVLKEEDQYDNTDIPMDMHGKIINSIPEPRFGHSIVAYQNTLILFGGENKYYADRKKRELYIDIYYYHILGNVWEKINWREKIIYGRKYHAAVIIGTNMIVHGGYNQSSIVIESMDSFSLTDHKWRDTEVGNEM